MLNAKELFLKTLQHEHPERIPCAPHWWGLYKYEITGRDYRHDAWQDGQSLAQVYVDFYEKFTPDWFHLHIGTPKYFRDSEITLSEGKSILRIDPAFRGLKKEDRYFSVNSDDDEEIVDFPDYILGSRASKPKVHLGNRTGINDYVKKYIHMNAEQIRSLGYTDHIPPIAERYGAEVFIAVHIPSAVCEIFDPITGYLGFETGLLALQDYEAGIRYLLERCYEEQLEWVRAYTASGTHAYVISESYLSPDIVGPEVYRNVLKPIHRDYFIEVERMGLIPMCHFWGDVNPLVEDLKAINIRALLIEESKKTFTLNAPFIREALAGRLTVFGNIDSITLLHDGNPHQIRDEVLRQADGAKGGFVTANGSPITPGTPEDNVRVMIETTKKELRF